MKIGVVDTNLGLDHALALARDNEVFYYIDNGGCYPHLPDEISGYGFPIRKVEDMSAALDCDMVLITDCYYGRLADRLREEGRAVFGGSEEWTRIENDRRYGWRRLAEMGVAVPPGTIVRGARAFLDFFAQNSGPYYVKVAKYRGSFDTRRVAGVEEALVALQCFDYGPFLESMEFLIQHEVEGVEAGIDAFFNGQEFVHPYLYTIEQKGGGSIGVWKSGTAIDEQLLGKVAASLAGTDYRGNISFEFIVTADAKLVVIDPCARLPFPCSACQAHCIENYAEVVKQIANGEIPQIVYGGSYTAELTLYTDCNLQWAPIRFPKHIASRVGFRRCAKIDDQFWFVPGDPVVATAIGEGESPEEALYNALSVAEQIDCPTAFYDASFVDDALDRIAELNAIGGGFEF